MAEITQIEINRYIVDIHNINEKITSSLEAFQEDGDDKPIKIKRTIEEFSTFADVAIELLERHRNNQGLFCGAIYFIIEKLGEISKSLDQAFTGNEEIKTSSQKPMEDINQGIEKLEAMRQEIVEAIYPQPNC